METNTKDKKAVEDIGFIDIFAVLWKYKFFILVCTILCAAGAVIFSFISIKLPPEKSPLPNKYTAQAHMLINDSSSSSSSGVSSLLASSSLGSLASLAGIASSSSTYSSLAEYLITANPFLDAAGKYFNLTDKLNISIYPLTTIRGYLQKRIAAVYASSSGVFTITFTDTDQTLCRDVVNYAVQYLESEFFELGLDKNRIEKENLEKNISTTYQAILDLEQQSRNLELSSSQEFGSVSIPSIILESNRIKLELSAQQSIYTQLKTQYELLKINMASETPVFQILEMAEIPEKKSQPSRAKLCMYTTVLGAILSVILSFIFHAIRSVRADPVAMAKLGRKNG
jgi:uncharacterized protein involved in exopolysaccharide biosynthesis